MLVDDFVEAKNEYRANHFNPQTSFVWIKISQDGTVTAAIGSIWGYQCILQLTGNPRMDVKFKTPAVGDQEL